MGLEESFISALVLIKSRLADLTDEDLLQIYAYQKQATVGDINIPKPSILQRERASKYHAWKKLEGMSKEEAMRQCINLIQRLQSA